MYITDYVELSYGLEKLGHQTELYFINKGGEVTLTCPDADLHSFAPYASPQTVYLIILKCPPENCIKSYLNFMIWCDTNAN